MSIPELNKASLVCKDWACMVDRSQELWKGRVHKIQTFNTPPVRVCHGALTHKDCLYVYGGHVPSEQGDFITSVRSDLWEYNISTHEWKKVCNFEPLTETCPILYNDKMYIFGGFINSWRTSTIIEYDFATKKYIKMSTEDAQNVAGAPPKGRSAYSAVCYKNCMYIYGGWDGHESMNDIHCFNLDTKQWVPLEQATGSESVAPCVRSHCAWVWNDSMYIWGGFGQHGHPVDLFRYNFLEEDVSKRWTKVEAKGTPPCGRSRMKSFVHENRVLILGGWDRKKLLGDLWEFNMETQTWKELKHTGLPKGISQYSANLHKNIMLVFGGCSDGESSNNLYGFKMFSKQS
jgi:N-acetylneuraminic acid mutarotase